MEGYLKVTQVLHPFSGLGQINKDILQNAAERGSVVHFYCDCIASDLGTFGVEEKVAKYARNHEHTEKELEKVNGCLKSFEKWHDSKKMFKFLFIKRLFDEDLKLTGETDMLYESPEGLTLLDVKTSCSESKTWMLQGSAYVHLLKLAGFDVKRIEFLKLSKTGGSAKSFFYEENFALFKAHYDAYKYSFNGQVYPNELDYL